MLVGTVTVEDSQELGRLLREHDIPHNLLNAVTSDEEARIIRDAGAFGTVTVATNMAGRGTDILLEPGLNARIARWCAGTGEAVEHYMGLRVIGSEVNKSARIDLQLNGRSGRQGSTGLPRPSSAWRTGCLASTPSRFSSCGRIAKSTTPGGPFLREGCGRPHRLGAEYG